MTLLTRKVDYAILVMSVTCTSTRRAASAREIADRFRLSRAFVANILEGAVSERVRGESSRRQRRLCPAPAGRTTSASPKCIDALEDHPVQLGRVQRDRRPATAARSIADCPVQGADRRSASTAPGRAPTA